MAGTGRPVGRGARGTRRWYASLAGEVPPEAPLDADALGRFIDELDALLRREHDYDYCGIVYADDAEHPSLIKIYDPNNLGSSCGCGGARIPPRWVLSRMAPTAIEDDAPLPGGRKRWGDNYSAEGNGYTT